MYERSSYPNATSTMFLEVDDALVMRADDAIQGYAHGRHAIAVEGDMDFLLGKGPRGGAYLRLPHSPPAG
jgi:hypothetical protein